MIATLEKNIRFFFVTAILVLLAATFVSLSPKIADAHIASWCPGHAVACPAGSCAPAQPIIEDDHEIGETQILSAMREDFHQHREWIVQTYIEMFIPAYMLMTEQMSNVALFQAELVGELFDAKLHLESQRLFNQMQNEAAKDYHPSDSFCWFGTNVRSLSNSDELSKAHQMSMTKIALDRHLGGLNAASGYIDGDKKARWDQFVTDYCDPHDNNFTGGASGLVAACGTGAANTDRANIDIDFQRLIEEPRYLDVDFSNAGTSDDEEDVIALARNLYGHNTIDKYSGTISRDSGEHYYLRLRSVSAKRAVAENSYNAIVGMKSRGPGGGGSPQYLKSIMADLGMDAADVETILGENPSYYAQLEALGKKIFQNVDFFTDLYDKPVNVQRKKAALNAIELMLDREIFESELRHEMMMSVLLSSYLDDNKEEVYRDLQNAKSKE